MAVLRLRQPLKGRVGDQPEHRFEGATVVELLQALEREHEAVRGWILDERGEVRRHINVYVNGEPCEPHSPVGDEDRVDVLPAISGGR